ncbi:MAG: 16S rRNA (guanine(527)-N(7))-methyltransferase RsmG [Bacteroidota bacterium]|nr:16S rRNA (guanine(527)-N(7))-methyltransferase RsmG [Bacteroidota bacterium]
MDLISGYFPDLDADQKERFRLMQPLYKTWNARINLISRKDEDALYLHHILHSLAIAHIINFPASSRVIDVGSGGGFPGIPLAILFPHVNFTLLDSKKKKIYVCQHIIEALELANVKLVSERAEDHRQAYNYVIARAVAAFPKFYMQTKHLLDKGCVFPKQGIYYLKGGQLTEELESFPHSTVHSISDFFTESFFQTKMVIHLPAS